MADIGRDEADMGDNSFLDIRNYQYDDDDDVELLGVSNVAKNVGLLNVWYSAKNKIAGGLWGFPC